MSGNLHEWCSDWFHYRYYQESPKIDPKGPEVQGTFKNRSTRGGNWNNSAKQTRVSYRNGDYPDLIYQGIGFRIVIYN